MSTSRSVRPSFRGLIRSTATAGVATAVAVGVSVTALGTTSANALENPTVSLTVNGSTTTFATDADTVGDLLARRKIRVDGNDLLVPGPATSLTNGLDIRFRQRIAIKLVQNGERVRKIVKARTAAGVRRELNLPTNTDLRQREFENIRYKRSRIIGPLGKVRTGSDRVYEGSVAVVDNIRLAYPEGRYRIKHGVLKERSPLVRKGSIRVQQDGRDGRRHVTWRKRYVNQELVSKRVAEATVLREAKRRIVRVGTGPNWTGLARCESGGNPNAVNPAGFYGLYQFSLSTWHSVGGKGNPTDYGYWEQTKRAWILYKASGRSPWPHCGRYL